MRACAFYVFVWWASCSALHVVWGEQTPVTYLSDTPIYNYQPSSKIHDWIVVLKSGQDVVHEDAKVHAMCSTTDGCQAEGTPSKAGMPFMILKATDYELEAFIKKHREDLEYVETDLTIDIDDPTFDGDHGEDGSDAKANIEENHLAEDNIMQASSDRESCVLGMAMGTDCMVRAFGLFSDPGNDARGPSLRKAHTFRHTNDKCCSNNPEDKSCPNMPYKGCNLIDFVTILYGPRALPGQPRSEGTFKHLGPNGKRDSFVTDAMLEKYQKAWRAGCKDSQPAPTCTTTTTPAPPVCLDRQSSSRVDVPKMWNLDRIDGRMPSDKRSHDGNYGMPVSNRQVLDGRGVHVYVVDTGINIKHKDFEGRAIPTIETGTKKVIVCDPSDSDCASDDYRYTRIAGHGTHCAGTIGGKKSGVAKAVTLHACKVFEGSTKLSSTSRILLAVDWIVTFGMRPAVISMSLGSKGKSVAMKNIVDKATSAGIIVVVASGNAAIDACDYSPAYVDSAITVGAVGKGRCDQNGRTGCTLMKESYSNGGPCVDIHAPGKDIWSASAQDRKGYFMMSGTSMATPHVSAAAAMLLQLDNNMQPVDAKKYLKLYATRNLILPADRLFRSGTPNLCLWVTCFTTSTTTSTLPPPRGGTRRRGSRRRRRSKRRRRHNRRRRSKRRRGR